MAINTLITRGFGNGTYSGTIPLVTLKGYSIAAIIGGVHNIGEYFTTGGSVTITLYDPLTGGAIAVDDNTCNEIGSTGLYIWNTAMLTTQPTGYKEYIWKMTNGTASEGGVKALNPTLDDFTEQFIVHSEWYS